MSARNCRRLNFKSDRRTTPKIVGLLELDRARHERDWKPSVEELKKIFVAGSNAAACVIWQTVF
jgi:hypothetical protein